MKTKLALLTLLLGVFLAVSCSKEEIYIDPEVPAFSSLREALESIPQVDIIDGNTEGTRFVLFFEQDIDHRNPLAGSFNQQVSVFFRGFDRPTILVTEGYYWSGRFDIRGFGDYLQANIVRVEHRNYGESLNSDLGRWHYQTLEQSSGDLHCVYQALKNVFPCKWMSFGVSKSGETAVDYQYFYPGDMDLAVSFCAPFMTSLSDHRFGDYLFDVAGTPSDRELMVKGIRKFLEGGEQGFYTTVADDFENLSFSEYVFNVFDTFFSIFQSYDAYERDVFLTIAGIDYYMPVMLANTIEGNRDEVDRTYFIDAIREQGFPYLGYDRFADLLDGTSFSQDNVLRSFLRESEYWMLDTYDGAVRKEMARNYFSRSNRPLLLVYSQDDPWSAGQPDASSLSSSTKLIINPIGIHGADITKEKYFSEEIKDEILDYIHQYID